MKALGILLSGLTMSMCFIGLAMLTPAACHGHSATMSPQYEMGMGDYYMQQHDWANAARCYRQVIGMGYGDAEAHSHLGYVDLYRGESQKAAEEFAAALSIAPHLADAERGLDLTFANDSDREAYFQKVQAIVQKEPNNADAHATLAEQLLARGQIDQAQQEAQAALKLSPRLGHADCVLGRIAALQGHNDEAEKYLQTAVSEDRNDDDAWSGLGDLAMQAKDYRRAITCYRHAVEAAGEHADYYKKLARAYTAAGDTRDAARVTAQIATLPTIPVSAASVSPSR